MSNSLNWLVLYPDRKMIRPDRKRPTCSSDNVSKNLPYGTATWSWTRVRPSTKVAFAAATYTVIVIVVLSREACRTIWRLM